MSIVGSLDFLLTGLGFTDAGVEFACGLLHILEMPHLLDLALFPL